MNTKKTFISNALRPLRRLGQALLVALPITASANNIQVSNVTLTGQNTGADTWQVQFDLSWDNSWRVSTGSNNYDAAWIFIKYRFGLNSDWRHMTIAGAGHVAPAGSTVTPSSDLKGAFIHRSANGIGNVNYTGVQLQWYYGGSGVADTDPIDIRVLAVEMVYVPQGAFVVGDGTAANIAGQFEVGQTGNPYTVTSEAAITLGGSAATSLNAHNNVGLTGLSVDDFTYTTTQTLPAAFPKGFSAFYAMKYEVSEGQYVDMLNLVTPTQAAGLFPNQTGNQGHTIDDNGVAPDVYTTAAPERACGTSAIFHMAYADWAALRPMSELEWEKLARGTLPAVPNEYAWGSTALFAGVATMGSPGTAGEVVTTPGTGAIANHDPTNGTDNRPWRVAAVPASIANPTRVQASASYYGASELSGNVRESCVSVGGDLGRQFSGAVHGDGQLQPSGSSDISAWTSLFAWNDLKAKGGTFATTSTALRVSDRASNVNGSNFSSYEGTRLCRRP